MYNSLLIVDDFYDRPEQVRARALATVYEDPPQQLTYPGRNSLQALVPPGLDQLISRLVNEPVRASTGPGNFHCHFRITLAGEPSRYLVHVDPSFLTWVGLIYLSKPEDCQGGTTLFRHRTLNSDRTPRTEAGLRQIGVENVRDLLARDGNDPSCWEALMTLPMRYNRMVLYRPWLWHSAGEPFGRSLEDGRLIQLLAFEPSSPGPLRGARSQGRPPDSPGRPPSS